ncbi:MAG: ribonuclease HII [Patescibacteria group bacterium]
MKYIVGIDEAGRGPLAGPVTIGIVTIPKNVRHSVFNIFRGLKRGRGFRDSKKLSPQKREEIFEKIKNEKIIEFAVMFGSVRDIDKFGITRAIAKAIARGLKKLKINPKNSEILLDGSLKAPKGFKNQKTIIKGDEKNLLIALASIVAKVFRDKLMKRLAKKHTKYEFEINKGYGTKKHISLIKKHGLSSIHRKTFCKNIRPKQR